MSFRDICVSLYDISFRSLLMKWKTKNEINSTKSINRKPYVLMVDGRIPHGGMFDRLKGAISVYAISKSLGRDFRIDWIFPFDLRLYLEPNTYDWRIDENNMRWGFCNHNVVIAYGEINNPSRLWKNRKKESHFYYGYNSLEKINNHFKTKYEWGELYRELFRPTEHLKKYIDYYKKEIGSDYIAIHARFLNLLGDRTETDINPELPYGKRLPLMKAAKEKIKKINNQNLGMRLMIASDSMTFIAYIRQEIPSAYIIPGTVKHIDTAGITDDEENIKMFTDYYLMSGAKHVYSLWHKGMWKSAFPEYAAKIGNTKFSRIEF